jgi:ABC-type Fe3+-hydroxamate transport system substrate-binding protein
MLNAGSYAQYDWSTGSTNQSIYAHTPNTYSLTVTDANGCTGIVSIVVNMTQPPNVTSAFTVYPFTGCKPLQVHFTNTSTNATSYHWLFSGGGSSDSTNPTRLYSVSGNYTATLIAYDSTACGVFTDTSSQTYYYTVYIPPSQPHLVQSGDTLTITNFTNGIQWCNYDLPISGDTNSILIVNHTGCYQAIETDSNGCTSKSDTICLNFTGIDDISDNHGISIYPDPTNTILNIQILSLEQNEMLQITDVLGRKIYQKLHTENINIVDVSKWSEGVYFYQIIGEKETYRGKFIKAN